MTSLPERLATRLDNMAPAVLPTLARFVFAAVLLSYFWKSATTKLGDGFLGLFQPSTGAYGQIFPRALEAAGNDKGALGLWHWAVVEVGTLAEFILPALIVLGLLTRLAALGMIGFVAVQTLTDLYGHRLIEHAPSVGAWFDRFPDAVILDQRAFWVLCLTVIVFLGAGPLSLDRVVRNGLSARRAFPQQ